MRTRSLAALLLVAALAGAVAPAVAATETPLEPYGNETVTNGSGSWMDGVGDTSIDSIAGMVSRVGTFVVGGSASDPLVGPLLTGMIVAGIVVGMVGTSRGGVVAGGVMGISTLAVLTQGAGLVPTWVYGVAVIILGVMASAVVRRLLQ